MKKYYYSLFAAAAMLLATSCSQEEDLGVQSSSELTTFSVALNGETGSRAVGDGKKVNMLYYAVYDQNTQNVIYPTDAKYKIAKIDKTTEGDKGWTLELPLMKSETYDILFWAQVEGSTHYEFTELTDIEVKYDDILSNVEERDAFFNALNDFKASGSKHEIVLRRPFAQLNVATTLKDWEDAKTITKTDNPVTSSAVTVSTLATNFNVLTGIASATTPATVEFKANDLIDETLVIKRTIDGEEQNVTYKLLAMNYLLPVGEKAPNGIEKYDAAEGKDMVEVEFTLYKGESEQIVNVKVPSTPIQRNWRTNIIGDLLTGENFDIIIDNEFDNTENQEIEISADGIVKVDGIYHITKAEGLWALAKLVNYGSEAASTNARAASVGYTFKGETFVLDCDIDLEDKEWTPMDKFDGTFDGNKKTIKNFIVEKTNSAGLFGALGSSAIVKNLKVENATIIGNHYAGVIAGHGYVGIENCHVKNSSVTLTTEIIDGLHDNGDKAGAIIGYLCEEGGNDYVKNCTAENVTIRGYRDIGGLVGYANGTAEVSGNTISNSIIIIDKTNNYKNYVTDEEYHGGTVVGEKATKATVTNNTATDVEITYIGGEDNKGYYVDANGNYCAISGEGINNAVTDGATTVLVISEIKATEIKAEGKTVTIKGEGETAAIDFTGSDKKIECTGNLIFENLNIKMNCTNYANTGLNNNGGKHEYKNCNFYGTATVWGECVYTNCTFTATTDGQYAAFAQSFEDVTYDGCTFTASDRAAKICPIKRNNEPSTATLNVTYNNCTFNANKAQNKTAVEINNNGFIVNVAFNGETTLDGYIKENDYFASEGNGTTNVTFNGKRIIATNEQLAAAITEGLTEINLANGIFGIPSNITGKTITFVGMGDGTVFDFTKAYNVGDATITFKNLYIEGKNANVMSGYGIQHTTKTIKYENCTLNNHITSEFTGDVEYVECTFTGMYYIATYSVKSAKFTDCIFDREDSRAVLVYSHGNNPCKVTLEGCTFKAKAKGYTGVPAWTAAVEVDTSHITSKGTTVTITNCTADANYNGIVRDKSASGTANAVITVDGLTYVSEGVWKDAEGNYVVTNGDELNATIKVAEANSTIKLLAGTYEGVEMAGKIASGLTIQGTEDAIVKGIKCNLKSFTTGSELEGMTFKNVSFEEKGIYFVDVAGSPWGFVKNFTMTECTMIGSGTTVTEGNRLFDMGTDSPGSNQFINIKIEECTISNVGQGIRLGGLTGENNLIQDNTISNIGHNAITLRSVAANSKVQVLNNTISNGNDRAFRIGTNSGEVIYKDNKITKTGDQEDGSNFKANTQGSVTFEGNTVDGTSWNPLG